MKTVEREFFPKSERLFSQKKIDRLFDTGHSFIAYPLRIVYLSDTCDLASQSGISILISVPKKRIRHAVDRNRIKRLIRESIRLHKNAIALLYQQNGKQLHLALMYISNDLKPYPIIEKSVLKALNRLTPECLKGKQITNDLIKC